MKWSELNHKTIGIWGSGREGMAAKQAIECFVQQAKIIMFDDNSIQKLNECEIIVTSPGVSLYRDEIIKAKEKGILFTSGTDLFLANKPEKIKVLGVTGTKGKSTTATILYHLLQQTNKKIALGGNIGKPLLSFLFEENDFIVAELSSYQCASLKHFCDGSIILNLYPEHLQWHQTHENYFADKCRLAYFSHICVINDTNIELKKQCRNISNLFYFNNTSSYHIHNGYFMKNSEALLPINALPLSGLHNALNACAALSLIDCMNISLHKNQIQKGFSAVSALPHRLQPIGVYQGKTFIDDSISTTPESTIEALKTFENKDFITLIAGGFDRGQNYETLISYAKKLKNKLYIIALPDTGERLHKLALKESIKSVYALDMRQAVDYAFQNTPQNGVIILSPAAPSYNAYNNFEERGNDFAKQIRLYKN